jgi:Mn2+/Fe2+ NRAMP family transporter
VRASIGRVTGKGLAANIKTRFRRGHQAVVLLLLIANTLNIAADVAAMGEVAELVTGYQPPSDDGGFRDRHAAAADIHSLSSLCSFSEMADPVAARLRRGAVHGARALGPGGAAHRLARFTPNAAAAAVVVGVFGTTISPYLFFWQASEEVEDMQAGGVRRCARCARGRRELRRIRWDTWSGMFYSDLTAYFIILATAVTLHVAGITDINTAARRPARCGRSPANSRTSCLRSAFSVSA